MCGGGGPRYIVSQEQLSEQSGLGLQTFISPNYNRDIWIKSCEKSPCSAIQRCDAVCVVIKRGKLSYIASVCVCDLQSLIVKLGTALTHHSRRFKLAAKRTELGSSRRVAPAPN